MQAKKNIKGYLNGIPYDYKKGEEVPQGFARKYPTLVEEGKKTEIYKSKEDSK